jgi:hypothetical protein
LAKLIKYEFENHGGGWRQQCDLLAEAVRLT